MRALAGTVRMETPVLYFYAPRDTIVDVRVRFHGGVITEWFPHASVAQSDAPTAPGSTSAIAIACCSSGGSNACTRR